ncbi:MAG: hypothetical protein JXA30_21730 [Deltaproteobacteria bacterium]|nr:hypothetical protein [Deltaproteobacteria bacterium]
MLITRLFIVAIAIAFVSSCSGENREPYKTEAGKVKIPLITTNSDEAYRLAGTLLIQDEGNPPNTIETLTTTKDSEEKELEVELKVGGYAVVLQEGWSLYDHQGVQVPNVSVVSDTLEFVVKPFRATEVRFEFLIGDVDPRGGATITANADNVHALTGKVTLALSTACSPRIDTVCGPLSKLDKREVEFVMLFAVESDGLSGDLRQVSTGPVIFEFFGHEFLEKIVGPALNGTRYSFALRSDADGRIWFESTARLTAAGKGDVWESEFDLSITGSADGSLVEGMTTLATAGIPAFAANDGLLTLSASSTGNGSRRKLEEQVSGTGRFIYDNYAPESDKTGPEGIARDVILTFDEGNFQNESSRVILHDGELSGPVAAGELAAKRIRGRLFGQFEESRTNYLTYSREFENPSWTSEGVFVIPDISVAPDGSNEADKLIADQSSGYHYIDRDDLIPVAIGDYVSFSLFARAAEYRYVSLFLSAGSAQVSVIFNVGDGTVQSETSPSETHAFCTPVSGDWYRCTAVWTVSGTGDLNARIENVDNNGNRDFVGDDSRGVTIWQAQIEKGRFPTSPIETEAEPVTRLQDEFYWSQAIIPPAMRTGLFAFDIIPYLSNADMDGSYIVPIDWYGSSQRYFVQMRGSNNGEVSVYDQSAEQDLIIANRDTCTDCSGIDWDREQRLTLVFHPSQGRFELSGFNQGDGDYSGPSFDDNEGDLYYGHGMSQGLSRQIQGLISEPYHPPCDSDANQCPEDYTCVLTDFGHPICVVTGVEACDDHIDNDDDGLIDCNDSSCANTAECPEDCDDGIDNNLDGLIDCYDPFCFSPDCPEICDDRIDDNETDNDFDGLANCEDDDCMKIAGACPEVCDDEVDNDADGDVDCDDPDCWRANSGCVEICDDSRDNDGDGLTDCDDETDCMVIGSGCIAEDCDSGIDEDGDHRTDCADPDCQIPGSDCVEDSYLNCNDEVDNDQDGRTDCDDSDCANGPFGCVEICDDEVDNDADGDLDCDDPECWVSGSGCTENGEDSCSDGNDNDGDGFIDCADRDCRGLEACNDVTRAVAAYFSDGVFSNPSTRYIWYDDDSGIGTIDGPFAADKLATKVIDGEVFGQFEGERTNHVLNSADLDESAHWSLSPAEAEPAVTRLVDLPLGPKYRDDAFRIAYSADEASVVEQTVSGLTEGTTVSLTAHHHKDDESTKIHWRFASSNNAVETLIPTQTQGRLIWTKTYDSGDRDLGNGIAIDNDENVVIFGIFDGLPAGELFVSKLDKNGNELWTDIVADSDAGHTCGGVAIESNGNIIVAGNNSISGSGINAWIRKYDPSGNEIWTRTIADATAAPKIAIGSEGNLYISGYTSNDIYIAKLDSTGTVIWSDTHDVGDDDLGFAVAVDSEENVIAGGQIGDSSTTDIWVRKYDSNGNEIWTDVFDSGYRDMNLGVAVDRHDNIIVTGGWYVSVEPYSVSNWTRKYDPFGYELWTRVIDEDGLGLSPKVDSEMNIFVAGNIITGNTYGSERADTHFRKYDPQGMEIWSETTATGDQSSAYDIAINNKGYFYAVGDTYVYNEELDVWGSDIWVGKFSDKYQTGWRRAGDRRVVESGTNDVVVGLRNAEDGVGGSILAWNIQLEEGLFPSSPIVTVDTTVTRTADDYRWPARFAGRNHPLRRRIGIDVIPEYASDEVPAEGAYLMWFADSNQQMAYYISSDARVVVEAIGGSAYVATGVLNWNRGQKLSIVFDPDRGEISVSGSNDEETTVVGSPWATDQGDVILGRRGSGGGNEAAAFALISEPYLIERCDDLLDNDGDRLVDCADSDCWRSDSGCVEVCDDSIDNDGDYNIDCQDIDCRIIGTPCHPEICGNGEDDDDDDATDCQDTDCMGAECPETSVLLCSDGLDNDLNGVSDCADGNCWAIVGITCPEICYDGADNDKDGYVDCFDKDCGYKGSGCTEDNEQLCGDRIDNDGDGVIDCSDSGCRGQLNCRGIIGGSIATFSDGRYSNPSARYIGYADGVSPGALSEPFERNKLATTNIDGRIYGLFEGERTNHVLYSASLDVLSSDNNGLGWVYQGNTAAPTVERLSTDAMGPVNGNDAFRITFPADETAIVGQNIVGIDPTQPVTLSAFHHLDIPTKTDWRLVSLDNLIKPVTTEDRTLWTDVYDSEVGNDTGTIAGVVGDGNIVVVGVAGSLSGGVNGDFLVRKYTPDGKLIWSRTYDTGYDDFVVFGAVNSSGNVLVAGSAWNGSTDDIWVGEYDTYGRLVWSDMIHDNGPIDVVYGIAVDLDNNAYMVWYDGSYPNYSMRMRKYNSDRTVDPNWEETYNIGAYTSPTGLTIDSSGNVIVAGQTQISSYYNFLRKYSQDRSTITTWTYANGENEGGYSITSDEMNDIYVTGASDNGTNVDLLLSKYDGETGTLIWSRVYDSGAHDMGSGIDLDQQGNIYISGAINGETSYFESNDIIIAKYNADGDLIWTQFVSGELEDGENIGIGIAVDRDDDVVVAGHVDNSSSRDLWISKIANENWQRADVPTVGETSVSSGLIGLRNSADGSEGSILAWNVQLEEGRFPSSPIITEDTPVTRLSDEFWWPEEVVGPDHALRGRFAVDIIPEYASSEVPKNGAYLFWFADSDQEIAYVIMPAYEDSPTVIIAVEEAYSSSTTYVETEPLQWNRDQKLTLIFDPALGEITVEGIEGLEEPLNTFTGRTWFTNDGPILMGRHMTDSAAAAFALISQPYFRARTEWTSVECGTGFEFVGDLAISSDGSIFAVGGTKAESTGEMEDLLLRKYDENGVFQSDTVLDISSFPTGGLYVVIDKDDNIIIGAIIYNAPEYRTWIGKYSSGGVFQWGSEFVSGAFNYVQGLAVDGQGNTIATGIAEYSTSDIWVRKYSSNGDILWTDIYDGGYSDHGRDVTVDDQDDIYVIGETKIGSQWYTWLRKYDKDYIQNDEPEWTEIIEIEPLHNTGGKCITVDEEENVVAAGEYDTGSGIGAWVRKYNSNMEIQWTEAWHEGYDVDDDYPDGDWTYSINHDSQGNIYQSIASHNGKNTDIIINKYNPEGNLLWSETYDGGESDYAPGIETDAQANAVVISGVLAIDSNYQKMCHWLRKYPIDPE